MKKLFDTIASLIGLALFAPLIIAVGIAIKITSPGPVFYRGTRTGLHGNPFKIYKFRTMVDNAEKMGGPSTAHNDKRLTRLGRILRKYKIDELPQLINILKGEVSFVGPRPQVEKYTKLYNGEEKIMLSVRPGLTDYASIRFINLDKILGDKDADLIYMREIEPEKNRLRIKYVREQSFETDMKIILLTLLQMLKIKSLWKTKDQAI